MKRIILAALIFTLMALPSQVLAEEAAKYSFASAQGSSNLQVIPGEDTEGVVYFYNVDGNRITHVVIDVLEVPDGWTVEVAPPLAEQKYDVGGTEITVTENLYAIDPETDPKYGVFAEEITDVPDGMICLTLPNKLGTEENPDTPGYCLAKPVTITISVPDSVDIGTTGDVKILATGSWLGQTGAAAIAQTREFDYTVQTVLELTNETPITSGGGFDIGKWLPWIIVGVVVIGAGFIILRLSARNKGALGV